MNKEILQRIAPPYALLILLWILADRCILQWSAKTSSYVVAAFVVSFLLTFGLMKRQAKKYSPDRLASIIISEVFHDVKLGVDYDEDILKLLALLEQEKGNSMFSVEQYKEFEKMRFDFSANVTHELKIPLTSIMGHAELIQAGIAKDEKAREFAGVIRTDADKLLSMIDNIIALSRYSKNGAVELRKTRFDLKDVAEKSVEGVRNIASLKEISIEERLDTAILCADREKIGTVITNLLTNAVKYNKRNGMITISTGIESGMATIRVRDTGIGVSKKDAARVFERFYVADKSRGKNAGTGLGLALVKHITIAHGGTVELISSIGSGAEFIVRLPLGETEA